MTDRSMGNLRGTQRNTAKLLRRFAFRGIGGFITVFVIFEIALPAFAKYAGRLPDLSNANLLLVLLALATETLSLYAYGKLTQSLLPRRNRPTLGTILKIDLSTLSVSHVLPGGTAAGAGLTLRLLKNAGVSTADSTFVLASQGIGSALVLNVIMWISLLVAIPIYGSSPKYLVVGGLGLGLLTAFACLLFLFTKGEERSVLFVAGLSRRIPLLRRVDLVGAVRSIAARLDELEREPEVLRRAIGWAALNWLADAACLYVMIVTFGGIVNPFAILVAYGLANVLAVIPATPGGLGIVEVTAVAALIFFRIHEGVAILGVVGWRLLNFWLPIPVGVAAYISLRLGSGVSGEDVTMELDRLDIEEE